MKPRVYIETTIPSFYFETRTEADMVARREWTREWWDGNGENYEIVSSRTVTDELRTGKHPNQMSCLERMASVPLLPVNPEIAVIVQTYIINKMMPNNDVGDALHLAVASFHKCDFLLTWNCQHLANANKYGHIRKINAMLGLFNPQIVTPLELLESG